MIEFVVFGVPAPKGSKSAFPFQRKDGTLGVAVIDAGKPNRQKDWARRVEEVVQELAANGTKPIAGPVSMSVDFYMPKPQSAPKRRKTWPDRKPDIDKLLRALLDPMSRVLIVDDARVVSVCARKAYADDEPLDQRPRAHVRVWPTAQVEKEDTQ